MDCRTLRKALIRSIAICSSLGLIGCGHSLNGTYSGKGTGFLDKMTFKSGGKVELTFMGMTKEGAYEVEGSKVKITIANETQVLTLDSQGCLDGGGMLGRYCKEGSAAASAPAADPILGIYEAGNPGGGIRLEFQAGSKVRVTVADSGVPGEAVDGQYQVSGNRVTIQVPRGESLTLTKSGDVLEGSLGGPEKISFRKKGW